MAFKVSKVDNIPSGVRTESIVYDNIVKDIASKPAGMYEVTIEGKKVGTLYIQLNKRIRKTEMRIYKRGERLFIEKYPTKSK